MYYGDHPPPHVHIRMRDSRESIIEINSLKLIGSIDYHELKDVILWVKNNKNELLLHWEMLNDK